MGVQQAAAASVVALIASLALSACSGGTTATATSSGGAASGSGQSSSSSSPSTGSGSTGSSSSTAGGSAGGSTGQSATGTTTAVGSSSRCHTTDLGYSWATGGDAVPNGNAQQQQKAVVMVKNTSGHPCTMHGFPGVNLVNSGQSWSLGRDNQSPVTLTLKSGDSTQFTVTFLPWSAEGNVASNNFAPTTLVITPPNETASYDLPWRWGHVLLQDAATHPGTYIGPIGD